MSFSSAASSVDSVFLGSGHRVLTSVQSEQAKQAEKGKVEIVVSLLINKMENWQPGKK